MLIIPPRPLRAYSITLSQNEITGLGLRFLAIGGFMLLMGIAVSFLRRR